VAAGIVSVAARSIVPSYLAPVIGAVVGALIGVAIARLIVPAGLLRAFEAFSWMGRAEIDRFEARTGGEVPMQRPDQEHWLEAHPRTAASQLPRIEMLAFLGRTDEALAELQDVVATEPQIAFERASLVQYVGWLSDGDAGLDALRASIAGLPLDEHFRREAEVTVAIADARGRFMRGEAEWWRPLQIVRPLLGSAAARVVWRDTWRQLAVLYLVVGLLIGAATYLFLPLN
jgi:hypothetical protein